MRAGAILGLVLGLSSAVSSVHAAPPEGPSEPSASLPSYDTAPIAAPIAAPIELEPAPPTGAGRIVAGSLLLAGGSVLFWGVVGLWATPHSTPDNECDPTASSDDGDCRAGAYDGLALLIEIPVLIAGAGALASGGGLLGTGIAAHRTYREWEREQPDRPVPPRGAGMLGSGVALMCTGVTAGALTFALSGNPLEDPGPATAFTTSVVVTLGGVGLAIGSSFLRRKHVRWQNARMAPSLSLLPGARPGIGGLSFGVAGRF